MRKFLQFTLSLLAMLMVTINASAWKWTGSNPKEGTVSQLGTIILSNPNGDWLDWEEYPVLTIVDQNGVEKKFNSTDDMSGGTSLTPVDYQPITANGTYTLSIPAGKFHINGQANDAVTFTWKIGEDTGGGEQGGGTVATPWTFKSVTPAIGEVKSLKTFTFKMEDADNTINYNKTVTLKKDDGTTYSATIKGNILNGGATITLTNEVKDPGTYTLEIPEGLLEDSKFVKNAAMSYAWTIPGSTGWTFTSVTPATGEVTSLKNFEFVLGSGNGLSVAKNLTLKCNDGSEYTVFVSDLFTGTIAGNLEEEIKTAGTYTLEIPAQHFMDWSGKENQAMTYSWTIVGGSDQGGGSDATGWAFTSVTPATGEVTSLKNFEFVLGSGNGLSVAKNLTLKCNDGSEYTVFVSDLFTGTIAGNLEEEIKTAGTYTLEIPAQYFMDWSGKENQAMTYSWTIAGGSDQGGGSDAKGWAFTSVTPEQGEVKAEDLELIVFEMPQSVGGANEIIDLNLVDQDGTTYKYKFSDNFGGAIHANYVGEEGNEPSKAGTYTLTIPASSFTSFMDETTNAAMTYTWTVKASTPPAPTYTVSYDKVNNLVQVKWPEGTTIKETDEEWGVSATIDGYPVNGGVWSVANAIDFYPNISEGDHTLNIAAGQFTINGTANEALSAKFTVSSGSQGGGSHDFDGQPWHEQIFKAGETTVSTPVSFKTDGVEIATESGQTSVGTVEFRYNLYEENELDWMNGTKIIITAKQDVNKIILIPTASGKNAIAYATAVGGDGEYNNGVWEGKLNAGETLTLTSNDGTQIKDIYVCYNGDDFDPAAGGGENQGVITVQWPVENQAITQITDGGTLAKFTTNKQYAYVTVELRNVNDKYHDKYDLPMRYMDGLAAGEQTCTTSTPGTSSTGGNPAWIPYNGDAYELVIKGYVNYWDDDYDAMAVVPVRGESAKEHEPESNETLVKITPTTATEVNMDVPRAQITNLRDNIITFEFSGKVSKFNAVRVGSLFAGLAPLPLVTAPIDEDGKIWTVTIPKDDILNNHLPGEDYNFEITAYDAENAVLLLNDRRADNALAVIFEVTDQDVSEDDVKTLGDLTFSVEDYPDGVPASTTSILVTFPEAQGFSDNVIAKVSGSLTCMDMSAPVEFSDVEGTLAGGVSVPVSLTDGKGYNFTITSVALSEKTTVEQETFINPIGTYNGQWNTQFNVGEEQGGGEDGDNILGKATFTADENGITVAWPNADLEGTGADYVAFQEWTISVNGENISFYPENIDGISDGISVTIPYEKIAVYDPTVGEWGAMVPVELTSGDKIAITIPQGAIEVDAGWDVVYVNESAITGEVTVPSNEPAPTSVVLYEKGVNPEVAASVEGDDARDLVIEGTDVTLAISNTATTKIGKYINNAYINNSKGGIITTNTNVMKFTSSRTIEKIEFTASKTITQKTGTSCVGTLADNVWTGEASEISIAIGQNTTNISKIVVYFKSETPKVKATMSIGAAKWGTFVAPFEVTIPAGVTAYKVTGRNEGVLDLEEVATTIPANTPVVVYSESQVAEDFEDVAVDGTPEAGMLVGVYDEAQVAEGSYVLQNHDGVVGFYKVGPNSNKAVKANRCYLVDSSNARAAYFFTEEDATAINGINADVLGAEGIYNASGVRVNSLQKGLNIIKTANGTKKVMIK